MIGGGRGGDRAGKGRGFCTPTCKGRTGGPVDGLRQEHCCDGAGVGGGGREKGKKRRRRKAGQEADPVLLAVDQSGLSATVLEVTERGGCLGVLVGEEDEISGGEGGVEADPQGQLFWEGGAGNQHSASHLQGGEKKKGAPELPGLQASGRPAAAPRQLASPSQ